MLLSEPAAEGGGPAPATAEAVNDTARRLRAGCLHAPHAVLGRHTEGGEVVVRAWIPGAARVWLEPGAVVLSCVDTAGLFEARGSARELPAGYRLRWQWPDGVEEQGADPYAFDARPEGDALARFAAGEHCRAWQFLGAHVMTLAGVRGTRFAVWAPNAARVSVVGEFNGWYGLRHPMSVLDATGIWWLFVPGLAPGALYKFELRNRESGEVLVKTDPFARRFERRPATACVVEPPLDEAAPIRERVGDAVDWLRAPMAIYELHPGSWQRHADGGFLDYRELADRLVEELADTGFSHVELMPITEHPLDESWGYQTVGYFAPTSRFGDAAGLRYLVDTLHAHGYGVILDWTPGHFARDEHALARFDGTALFEHADPMRGESAEWGSLVFNYGRNEVRSFLISSALYWLEHFGLDGLRIDAVASMLYLDYGRAGGDWVPNRHGGRENLEAVAFLQALNTVTHRERPGSVTIAEESTAWPGVTRPVHLGGLGFSMKWNMGWMHDMLEYMRHDPVHRHYHHDSLTFGLLYAHSENYVLPFSHDEVVHGKGSLLDRMPGDRWQKFANLRLLYSYMYAYPGKKLLFMGCELGAPGEWSDSGAIDRSLLHDPFHRGVRRLVGDLNSVYRRHPALHREDFTTAGFEWIDCHDAAQSVLSFLRRGGDEIIVAAFNFTPVPRLGYRLGVPEAGRYEEVLNSDADCYAGSNLGNLGGVTSRSTPWMGRAHSLTLTLPPLAGVLLRWSG